MKPLVGITQRVVENESYPETRDALAQDWYRFFDTAGLVFLALPNDIQAMKALISAVNFSGFVLSGGNDIGQAPMRDAAEEFLMGASIEGNYPVIGICRGMQMMQSYLGGALQKVERHVGTRHNLVCEQQARGVNSYHSIGFMKPATGFEVIAYADDGSVEAMRHKGHNWLGLMWHPEREDQAHPQDIEFFRNMFVK